MIRCSTKDNDDIIISTLFNSVINPSYSYTIGYKNYPGNASCLRVKTSKHIPWLGNHNLNVHLYVKTTNGDVYDYHYFDQNCSNSQGYALSGRFASQVNVSVLSVGAMTSCLLTVTATAG